MRPFTKFLCLVIAVPIHLVIFATVVGMFCPSYAPPTNWPQDPASWKTYQPWRGSAYVIR